MKWQRSLALSLSIASVALTLDYHSFPSSTLTQQKQKASRIVKRYMLDKNAPRLLSPLFEFPRFLNAGYDLYVKLTAFLPCADHMQKTFLLVNGVPGLSVAVSCDGYCIWNEGFGYANVEQLVPCTSDTVMRIASISKPLTAAIAACLVQTGKLQLDAPIQDYVPDFPKKKFGGKDVIITVRQLLNHTSGIRHYKMAKVKENQSAEYQSVELRDESEFFSNIHYDSVTDALEIFKYDELVAEPGSKFRYTTYGFTLLSAALEKAVRSSYSAQVTKFFEKLGMNHSYLDFNLPLIANRASYYYRDLNHKLNNVPEVDNSNKWAGGGLLSTAKDLLIFANAMLYSYYISEHSLADVVEKKPLLDPETIKTFWESKISDQKGHVYTLGWFRIDGTDENYGGLEDTWLRKGIYMHTGAGVGASSVLLIKPNQGCSNNTGTCVVILTNLHECSELVRLALEIAEIFESTTLGAVS
ncbi:unnamed protein product [Thelazia callipaeda]|uniref:Beta-lactamase domain-containing protein n=1 Tax=Thelazia callipaeda TaxID=103827 RepID=A0A0N5D1E4_THECL|nr:unnamed protein product [Thelazia callipaeda]